jgi:hypothetical protein
MVGIFERHRVVIPCGIGQEILMVCPPYEKNISAIITNVVNFRLEVGWLECVRGSQ